MSMPIITLAVTTYKRSESLRDLVISYILQEKPFPTEMVVINDCPEDSETDRMMTHFQKVDTSIRYIRNDENIGYSKNYLKSILMSQGKYIMTVGDDDILISSDALVRYTRIFDENPNVGFIYGNILQFDKNRRMDYAYFHFSEDSIYSGKEAIEKMWLKSCFIGGIGLRNGIDFESLYPRQHKLFPQVEMVGKLLADWDAYGTTCFAVAARAHEDQLGFAAMRGKRIKQDERESAVELYEIYDIMRKYYSEKGAVLDPDTSFIVKDFIQSDATALPTQKINTGNVFLMKKIVRAVRKTPSLLLSPKYMFFLILSLLLPKRLLFHMKESYKKHLVRKLWDKERRIFDEAIARIRDMEKSVI